MLANALSIIFSKSGESLLLFAKAKAERVKYVLCKKLRSPFKNAPPEHFYHCVRLPSMKQSSQKEKATSVAFFFLVESMHHYRFLGRLLYVSTWRKRWSTAFALDCLLRFLRKNLPFATGVTGDFMVVLKCLICEV